MPVPLSAERPQWERTSTLILPTRTDNHRTNRWSGPVFNFAQIVYCIRPSPQYWELGIEFYLFWCCYFTQVPIMIRKMIEVRWSLLLSLRSVCTDKDWDILTAEPTSGSYNLAKIVVSLSLTKNFRIGILGPVLRPSQSTTTRVYFMSLLCQKPGLVVRFLVGI